jgi:hypothetical protein
LTGRDPIELGLVDGCPAKTGRGAPTRKNVEPAPGAELTDRKLYLSDADAGLPREHRLARVASPRLAVVEPEQQGEGYLQSTGFEVAVAHKAPEKIESLKEAGGHLLFFRRVLATPQSFNDGPIQLRITAKTLLDIRAQHPLSPELIKELANRPNAHAIQVLEVAAKVIVLEVNHAAHVSPPTQAAAQLSGRS